MRIGKKTRDGNTRLRYDSILTDRSEVVKSGKYIISNYDIGYNIQPHKMKPKMYNLD